MSIFSEKHVGAAIDRLPRMATQQIASLLVTARIQGLQLLTTACEAELALRPVPFTDDMAKRFDQMAKAVAGAPLHEAIQHAFAVELPVRDYELKIIRKIASEPGILFRELEAHYGKRDTSLVIGHLVYDRFGCFRHLLGLGEAQSDLLLVREKTPAGVRYWLRDEAEQAYRSLGLF